jgi:hypothetical protein
VLLRSQLQQSPDVSDVASTVIHMPARRIESQRVTCPRPAGSRCRRPDRSGPDSTIVGYTLFIKTMQIYFTMLPYILILSSQTIQKDHRLPFFLFGGPITIRQGISVQKRSANDGSDTPITLWGLLGQVYRDVGKQQRSRRDSNPRGLSTQRFSRPSP